VSGFRPSAPDPFASLPLLARGLFCNFRDLLVVAAAAAVVAAGCEGRRAPAPPAEVVVATRAALAEDPLDAVWRSLAAFPAPLILQDMVEPRLLEASTPEVRVRAMSDGARVAFHLEWDDPTADDLPGADRFGDACAVQLPARVEPNVPAPQMGEPGRVVEITYWNAFWQAAADGRPDTIGALYPGAAVDHYPFEAPSLETGSEAQRQMADRYAPAHALGNTMAGPRARPVQDLIAEGPGTLRPAPSTEPASNARGRRTENGWAVVLTRPLPAGLAPGSRSQVAFAVWEGSRREVGARKMRSVWLPMVMEGKD
jgi:DMSO reductase family type II enzyme heme b subunit